MAEAKKARVAINGYGVIGKRVADAVAAQDDMELVGVADVVSDYRIRVDKYRIRVSHWLMGESAKRVIQYPNTL